MFKFRLTYFILFVILLATEICIAKFFNNGFIRNSLGDFLVVILIYCFIRSFLNTTIRSAAVFVLLFSYLVEYLQYLQIVEKLNLHNKIVRIIIGTSFEWADILAYTLGIGLVLIIEKAAYNKNIDATRK
jgi:uncharacterized protein DUF2809